MCTLFSRLIKPLTESSRRTIIEKNWHEGVEFEPVWTCFGAKLTIAIILEELNHDSTGWLGSGIWVCVLFAHTLLCVVIRKISYSLRLQVEAIKCMRADQLCQMVRRNSMKTYIQLLLISYQVYVAFLYNFIRSWVHLDPAEFEVAEKKNTQKFSIQLPHTESD